MNKLISVWPDKIIKVLRGNGFECANPKKRGSDKKFRRELEPGNPDIVIVPVHGKIKIGTLRAIIRQSGKERREFIGI